MSDEQAAGRGDPASKKPTVYIYGGGVTGLTAAHELIIRGFNVHLYEKESALGPEGAREEYSLGGMARTQYVALEVNEKGKTRRTGLGHPFFSFGPKPKEPSRSEDFPFIGLPLVRVDAFDKAGRGQGPEASTFLPGVWVEVDSVSDSSSKNEHERRNSGIVVAEQSRQDWTNAKEFLKKSFKPVPTNPTGMSGPRFPRPAIDPLPIVYVQAFVDSTSHGLEQASNGGWNKTETQAQQKAQKIAKAIKDELDKELAQTRLKDRVKVYDRNLDDPGLPAYAALGLPPTGRNWARIIVYRPVLPGEHGYRFFPSFYRHVFESMRRTPLYDPMGQPTQGTVYDNLVSLPRIGIFSERAAPFIVNWEPPPKADTFSRVERNLQNLQRLDVTSQDITQFALRILRYMTTCPERRAQELEDLSWWDYLEGYNPKTGTRLYRYSSNFAHTVKSSSRILAALDGERGDARTCGNTYVQLLTEALVPTPRSICTLNGPTSEAWFAHWRAHLKRLGVQFHRGELLALKQRKAGAAPVAKVCLTPGHPKHCPDGTRCWTEHPTPKDLTDNRLVYLLVATDLVAARKVSKSLWAKKRWGTVGMPMQLARYVDNRPAKPGDAGSEPRDPTKAPGRGAWDRLQTISGIQFFFTSHVNIADGYMYCVDSPWGLSAICSHIAWRDPPIERLSSYQSVLSVDIGEWQKGKKKAWKSTPRQLAREVYAQIKAALKGGKSPGEEEGPELPNPDWVHIDHNIVFGPVKSLDAPEGRLRPRENLTPYLVPTVGDWKWRPGPEPWNPTRRPDSEPPQRTRRPKPEDNAAPLPDGLWQATHGGYWVHWNRLVFAGTYTRTFTRLTTMESANESARHAVNAILDHVMAQKKKDKSAGLVDEDVFPASPLGDYCRIWDPERNELPDVAALQRLDAHNFQKGLPHPWDMLGLERLPSLFSYLPGAGADPFGRLADAMRMVGDKAGVPGGSQGLMGVLQQLRSHFENAMPRPPHEPPYRR